MLDEKDLILRTIQQLARAVANAMRRALGLAQQGQNDQALQELESACREHFGLDSRLLTLMDLDTLVRALGHPEKQRLFAELLQTEAVVREQAGDPARAALLRERAEGLLAQDKSPPARTSNTLGR